MKTKTEEITDTLLRLSYDKLISDEFIKIIDISQFGEITEDIEKIYASHQKETDWDKIHKGLQKYCYLSINDVPKIGGKCIDYLKQNITK